MTSTTGTLVLLATLLTAAAPARREDRVPPEVGVLDAALTRLFTPRSAPAGTYGVYRSPKAIAALVAELRALDPDPVEDAWKVVPLAPADAFGSDEFYVGPRLARLYVGTRPSVARGSLRTSAGLIGYTLIAPWPDATLTTLRPGTMVIVVDVTRLTAMR